MKKMCHWIHKPQANGRPAAILEDLEETKIVSNSAFTCKCAPETHNL